MIARWMVEGIQHDPDACFHAVRDCQRELANVAFVHLFSRNSSEGDPWKKKTMSPCTQAELAETSSFLRGGGLLERVCVAFIDRSGASAVAFRPCPPLIVAIHGSSHVCGHPLRSATIPGAPLLAPAPCHASHFPLLPMRPSTRHFWPSSSIMCGGWGPWQKRVGSGTGCHTSLPRRRWSSLNQRDVEGLGRRRTSSGWQKIGDCCGWFVPLLRRPTRNRHHHGVPSPQGRTSNTRSSVHSRGRIAQSPPQERANLSRAAWSRWKGTSCGACC